MVDADGKTSSGRQQTPLVDPRPCLCHLSPCAPLLSHPPPPRRYHSLTSKNLKFETRALSRRLCIYSQHAATHTSAPSGSIGMVIVVLAVITTLGVVVEVVGHLCAGRRFSGDSKYDFEGWVERKCSTCIDGHLDGPGGHTHIPMARLVENGENQPPEGDQPQRPPA